MTTNKHSSQRIPLLLLSIALLVAIAVIAKNVLQARYQQLPPSASEVRGASPTPSYTPTPTPTPNTVGAFSFQPLPGWALTESERRSSYARFITPEKIAVEVNEEPNEKNFSNIESWIKDANSIHPEIVTSSSKPITVAGVSAIREEYTLSMKKYSVVVWFMYDNQLYWISAAGLNLMSPTDAARAINSFDQFVNTFFLH